MKTKKSYITPNTTSVSFISGLVCQVGSVHGNALQYGGNSNGLIDPM